MDVTFVKDYDEMSKIGYELIKEIIETKNEPVISLNSGGSPKGLFKYLVKGINEGLDISNTTILVLDEFIGPSNASFIVKKFIYDRLLNKINQQPKNIFFMNSAAEDINQEITRYSKILNDYPRDLQLLGLGTNGHIAGNEPGTPFNSTMSFVESRESTIQATMKEYNLTREEAPTTALTLGLSEIMDAEKILLLISGEHKAEATKKFLEGDITTKCPVTILKKSKKAKVIIDASAASLVENDYEKEFSI